MASAMDVDDEEVELPTSSSSKGEKKRFEVKKVLIKLIVFYKCSYKSVIIIFSGMQLPCGLGVSFIFTLEILHNCASNHFRYCCGQLCHLPQSHNGFMHRMPGQSSFGHQWRMHSGLGSLQCNDLSELSNKNDWITINFVF